MRLILAIFAFNFVVLFHEIGHFAAAKLSGIRVLELSLFIGPKIFSFRRGETTYSLRLIPALAYVKLEGEDEASDSERSYGKKPLWARIMTIGAGPFMSIFLGVIFLSITYSIMGFDTTKLGGVFPGSPAYTAGLRTGDRIISYGGKRVYQPMDVGMFLYETKGKPAMVEFKRGESKLIRVLTPDVIPANRYILGFSGKEYYGKGSNIVKEVSKDSPAEKGGIRPGDEIVKLGGREVSTKQEIMRSLYENGANPITVTVIRDGRRIDLQGIKPVMEKSPEAYDVGLLFSTERGNIFGVLGAATLNTYSITRIGFYSILWLIKGEVPFNQMMGPIGAVSAINNVVQQSPTVLMVILDLLKMSVLISIGLGVTNLLPVPPADGSKLLLLIVEGIRGKPIPSEKEALIMTVGFFLMILLFVVTAYNDIVRVFTG